MLSAPATIPATSAVRKERLHRPAITAMAVLRCLHPPGGAAALTAALGGPAVATYGLGFAFVPVGLNALVLTLLGGCAKTAVVIALLNEGLDAFAEQQSAAAPKARRRA